MNTHSIPPTSDKGFLSMETKSGKSLVRSFQAGPNGPPASTNATPKGSRWFLVDDDTLPKGSDAVYHQSDEKSSTSCTASSETPFFALPTVVAGMSLNINQDLIKSDPPRALALGTNAMNAMRSMMGRKPYRAILRLPFDITSTAGGVINSLITVNALSTLSEFASFATLFDEFFVHSMQVRYEPYSEYQFNVGTTPGTNKTNVGLGVVSTFHGAANYSTYATLLNNSTLLYTNTAKRWTKTWKNNESPSGGIAVSSSTSLPIASQGWCLTQNADASLYTGNVQVFGSAVIGTGLVSVTPGTTLLSWDVSFRMRA
jgi:hypothetical protein